MKYAYSIERLRQACAGRLPRCLLDFYEGGAEDEETLRHNGMALNREALWPRALGGIIAPDYSRMLFGHRYELPFGIAPMGAVGLGWPQADLELCAAAADMNTVYTLSTMATATVEEIAATNCAHRWFQAHLFQPRERTLDLVRRAQAGGYEALVVTVDLPVGGKRERDLANGFTLPFRPGLRHLVDFAVHPRWLASILVHGVPRLPNLHPGKAASAALSTIGHGFDGSFDWRALETIRTLWKGPLVLKGVLCPEDAVRATGCGVDAVWVSNHGGRQLDGCVASLTALPLVKAAVAGRVPVLFDGGIRRGQHVLKAYAAGADFVFLGRSVLYGVCSGGRAGALRALDVVRDELVRAMQLCSLPSLQHASRLVVPAAATFDQSKGDE